MRLNGRCPICNTMYDLQKYRVIGERDHNILTYIQCSQCGSAVLSLMSINQFGLQAIGLLTDLTSEEVAKFESIESITQDDVIQLHQMLEDDGNIVSSSSTTPTKGN